MRPARWKAFRYSMQGQAFKEDQVVTAGGRVLGVTAIGKDIEKAKSRAYEAAGKIHYNGMHYRKDIAGRALNRQGQGFGD